MKENERIYFRENGEVKSITVRDYETDNRAKDRLYECMGVVTRGSETDVRALRGDHDGGTGQQQDAPPKDTGEPVCEERREDPSEAHNKKPV